MFVSNSNTLKQFKLNILNRRFLNRRFGTNSHKFCFTSPFRIIFFFIIVIVLYWLNFFYYVWNLEIPPAIIHSFNYITYIMPIMITTSNKPPSTSCAPCNCISYSSETKSSSNNGCIDDAELEELASSHYNLYNGGGKTEDTSDTIKLSTFFHDSLSTIECEKSLDSLNKVISNNESEKKQTKSIQGKTLWHVYWRLDSGKKDLGYTPTTVLESWLATQNENSVIVYWLAASDSPTISKYDVPPTLLSLIRLFPNRIRYRFLDVAHEAEGTPLQRSYLLRLHDSKAWVDSDIARLVIEYRYGGMYMDIDVLLLRDLQPLLYFEFVTEFSCDHSQSSANNAVMHIFRKSNTALGLLEASKQIFPKLMSWAYGPDMLNSVTTGTNALHIWKLPWCFFHGVWCLGAIPMDALGGSVVWNQAFLEKAFGIHLHGAPKSASLPHKDSVLGVYAKKHRLLLEQMVADSSSRSKEFETYLNRK